jgi:RimJ/RimL family protein N-acetyltransferase
MLKADAMEESDEFIVEHHGAVVGKLGAWRIPEIGFFLRRDCCGRGFATEALQRYVRYAKERRYKELTADVDPRNGACIRVLGKCGFKEIGRVTATYVVNGLRSDSIYLHLDLDGLQMGGGHE